MAEGINVSSPLDQQQQQRPQPRDTKQPMANMADTMEGVHLEVYRFFNINPIESGNIDQLKLVNNWATQNSKGIADSVKKIRQLEMKLGAPKLGETRVSKLYNWLRLNDSVNSLQTEFKQQLTSVQDKVKKQLSEVATPYREKLQKLNEELKQTEQNYRRARRSFQLNANTQTLKLKKDYETKLKELRTMRDVYKGGKK